MPDAGPKFPGQLSGGQQQRIALARALATSPGLLLLDEPLSALDALERVRLRGEIRALQQRLGVTTIMVTHDQEEALSIADRIVVMNAGCIEQVGTPREVYSEPATPFVADFVGKINVLPAVAEGAGRFRIGSVSLARAAATTSPPERASSCTCAPRRSACTPTAMRRRAPSRRRIAKVEFLGAFCMVGARARRGRHAAARRERPAPAGRRRRSRARIAGHHQPARVGDARPLLTWQRRLSHVPRAPLIARGGRVRIGTTASRRGCC